MPNHLAKWLARGYYRLAERLYNELAWIYDPVSWLVSLGQWDAWRKMALDYVVGRSVLEIGFGTGELLVEMRRRHLQPVGLDASVAMQRQATLKLRRYGFQAPLIRGAAQHLPFAECSFDTIISTFPSGYIFDTAAWGEAARVLKPYAASTQAEQGRFVVLGICGRYTQKTPISPIRLLFGQQGEDMLEHFKLLAQSVGLHPQVIVRSQGPVELPILIAERKA